MTINYNIKKILIKSIKAIYLYIFIIIIIKAKLIEQELINNNQNKNNQWVKTNYDHYELWNN